MAEVVYNGGLEVLTDDDVEALSLSMLLLASTTSLPAGALEPDLDTVADLLAVTDVDESVATNYSRVSLTTLVTTKSDTTDDVTLTTDAIVFPDLGEADGSDDPIRAAVIFKDGANDAARALVSIHSTGFPKALNGTDFLVNQPTGLLTWTSA